MLKHHHLQVGTDLKHLGHVLDWLNQIDHISLSEMDWLPLSDCPSGRVHECRPSCPSSAATEETPIDLEIKTDPEYLELYVWDHGSPFDLLQQLSKMPQQDQESDRGRGLIIMNQVADRLSYERVDEARNCLRMVKYVSGQP